MKAAEIMSSPVVTVHPGTLVKDAARRIEPTDNSAFTTVGDVMTRDVLALPDSLAAAEIARTMLEQALKHVPIVRGSEVVGIVSRRDILRALVPVSYTHL